MSVGYLCASFDLLNVRDLDLVEQALERCSRLVAAVHTDAYAERVSGRSPVVPLEERIALLRHVRGVDDVVAFDASTVFPDDALQFVMGGVPDGTDAQPLTPRRETSSSMLRLALQPQDGTSLERAVA
jgi:glycerol-3-phosphate cytidylyltransferase-like family protein